MNDFTRIVVTRDGADGRTRGVSSTSSPLKMKIKWLKSKKNLIPAIVIIGVTVGNLRVRIVTCVSHVTPDKSRRTRGEGSGGVGGDAALRPN